jgi:hypothetical protein
MQEIVSDKHDAGTLPRNVGTGSHGDAHRGLHEGRSIVHSITDHNNGLARLGKARNIFHLVLRKKFGGHLVDAQLVADVFGHRFSVAGEQNCFHPHGLQVVNGRFVSQCSSTARNRMDNPELDFREAGEVRTWASPTESRRGSGDCARHGGETVLPQKDSLFLHRGEQITARRKRDAERLAAYSFHYSPIVSSLISDGIAALNCTPVKRKEYRLLPQMKFCIEVAARWALCAQRWMAFSARR